MKRTFGIIRVALACTAAILIILGAIQVADTMTIGCICLAVSCIYGIIENHINKK